MRKLHVITTLRRGGAENGVRSMIVSEIDSGIEVDVLFLIGDQEIDLPSEVKILGPRSKVSIVAALLSGWRKIIQISSDGYDIVHSHLGPAELYTMIWIKPFVRSEYHVTKHNKKNIFNGRIGRFITHWDFKRNTRVYCISEAVKNYFYNQGFNVAKVIVVYYDYDFEVIYKKFLSSKLDKFTDEPIFGTLSRLEPQKNLHLMIDSFELYFKTYGKGYLLIYGRGNLEEKLQEYIGQKGLVGRVNLCGHTQDIDAFFRLIDVFMLTSDFEGLGMVLLESMARKKPIICTPIDTSLEICKQYAHYGKTASELSNNMNHVISLLVNNNSSLEDSLEECWHVMRVRFSKNQTVNKYLN